MKKLTTTALAALALATIITTSAKADDPVNPVQGAVCNLYLLDTVNSGKNAEALAASISSKPAAATFVDAASDFKPSHKKEGIRSYQAMWTGWMKLGKAGTYTFTCRMESYGSWYSIWINGQKCASGICGQYSFNVDLEAGFNSVKIVAQDGNNNHPLTITYKKAGSVKEPIAFGPENMFYDDDE